MQGEMFRPAVEIKRHWPEQIIARAESITAPGEWHTVIWTARDGWRCSCKVGMRKRGRCVHVETVIDEVGT